MALSISCCAVAAALAATPPPTAEVVTAVAALVLGQPSHGLASSLRVLRMLVRPNCDCRGHTAALNASAVKSSKYSTLKTARPAVAATRQQAAKCHAPISTHRCFARIGDTDKLGAAVNVNV
jgi:hypothetical protein